MFTKHPSLQVVISILILVLLSGCLFSAKEILLDPDKGSLHTQMTADREDIAKGD